jgi:hypothetical protein
VYTVIRWDSAACITTGYRLDGRRVSVILSRGKIVLLSISRPVLGPTQPPIQWVPGAFSPGIKWSGHEADDSPPTVSEVKNIWICISTVPVSS